MVDAYCTGQRAEGDIAALLGRQAAGFAHVGAGAVSVGRGGDAPGPFGKQPFAACRCAGFVGEVVVDCAQPGGIAVAQPAE